MHVPVHSEVQHTPSSHDADAHCACAVQPEPLQESNPSVNAVRGRG